MQNIFSLITIAVGLILLVYMITVEDEPGALPLFLIVAGAAWYAWNRRRTRSVNISESGN
jgi:hypothetical protein